MKKFFKIIIFIAIVILFVFVVMMLNINKSLKEERAGTSLKYWIVPLILSLILISEFIYSFIKTNVPLTSVKVVDAKKVGLSMFSTYLFVTELAGILLLVGIVGAYHLGRTKKRNLHRYNQVQNSDEDSKI